MAAGHPWCCTRDVTVFHRTPHGNKLNLFGNILLRCSSILFVVRRCTDANRRIKCFQAQHQKSKKEKEKML